MKGLIYMMKTNEKKTERSTGIQIKTTSKFVEVIIKQNDEGDGDGDGRRYPFYQSISLLLF